MDGFFGEALFLEEDSATIKVGREGLQALVAYPRPKPVADLLQHLDGEAESLAANQLLESSLYRLARTGAPAPSMEACV
jgi:hypothetical protein